MLSPDADQDFKVEGACEFSFGGGVLLELGSVNIHKPEVPVTLGRV